MKERKKEKRNQKRDQQSGRRLQMKKAPSFNKKTKQNKKNTVIMGKSARTEKDLQQSKGEHS